MQTLISTLTDWAKLDPTHRLELLRKAHDSAIRDLIENQGKDLTSATITSSDGSRLAIIPENATDDEKKELLGRLN